MWSTTVNPLLFVIIFKYSNPSKEDIYFEIKHNKNHLNWLILYML